MRVCHNFVVRSWDRNELKFRICNSGPFQVQTFPFVMIRPFLYLQSKASIWILFTKCSFKWYLVLPPCHLSWFTFQRRIYISSLECCLRENVRDDLQYKWYPMPFFHIWSIWHEIFGQENSKRSISSIHLGVFLDLVQLETAKLQNYFFLRFYCSSIPRKSVSSKSNFSAISPSQSVS